MARYGTSTREVVSVAIWFGWEEHMIGLRVVLKDWDDPDRLFTLCVGIPFVMAKFIIRSPQSIRERKARIAGASAKSLT